MSSFLARVYYVTFFSVLVAEEEEREKRYTRERKREARWKSRVRKKKKNTYDTLAWSSLKILLSDVFFFFFFASLKGHARSKEIFLTGGTR